MGWAGYAHLSAVPMEPEVFSLSSGFLWYWKRMCVIHIHAGKTCMHVQSENKFCLKSQLLIDIYKTSIFISWKDLSLCKKPIWSSLSANSPPLARITVHVTCGSYY